MISADAAYLALEAIKIGATPAVRATIWPYYYPTGLDGTGVFVNATYVSPGKILLDWGVMAGSWTSVPLATGSPGAAVITWKQNDMGYDIAVFFRSAGSLDGPYLETDYLPDGYLEDGISFNPWVQVTNGETVNFPEYYQIMVTWTGYRTWAANAGDTDDGSFAWAENGTPDAYQGYAGPGSSGGSWIANLQIAGAFDVTHDIEGAGMVTLEAPKQFDELVAGSHSGLLLNNRQVDSNGNPAPAYSPRKSSFIFAQDHKWYGKKLTIEAGFKGHDGSLHLNELFIGRLTKWGPVMRQMSSNAIQPTTCALYALDWISDMLNQRIAMPAEDGTPQPVTFGEFLCDGQQVVGWSPDKPVRTATFEGDNFNELDHLNISGGGAVSLITPGLTKLWGMRCVTSGASQIATGQIALPGPPGEIFVTGNIRFQAAPTNPVLENCKILQINNAAGASVFDIYLDVNGAFYSPQLVASSKFTIEAYLGQTVPFALWYKGGTTAGAIKVWINGSEELSYTDDTSPFIPASFVFGAQTGGTAENWTIDFDDLQVYPAYYDNAFQVFGGPFQSIGAVTVDGVAQPDTQTVGSYTQALARFPQYGMVQFTSTDPKFKPGNTIKMRVVMNPGGMHPVDVIQALLQMTPAGAYIDSANFAAAKAATPKDLIHCRFEDKGNNKSLPGQQQGVKDYTNTGTTVADAIKEIVGRVLYFFFVDVGQIRLIPYTGTPPSAPVLAVDASSMFEADPIIDMDTLVSYVGATFGAYDTNPSLYYVAGGYTQDGTGATLDFTWANSPVVTESYDMAKAKADLLLKFLSAQERLDPVRISLIGLRLELMDSVSVNDALLSDAPVDYWVMRKEIHLDPPHLASGGQREVDLQLMRFLGDG